MYLWFSFEIRIPRVQIVFPMIKGFHLLKMAAIQNSFHLPPVLPRHQYYSVPSLSSGAKKFYNKYIRVVKTKNRSAILQFPSITLRQIYPEG